jgi:hypothetical protein
LSAPSGEWRLVAPVAVRAGETVDGALPVIEGTLRIAFLSNHKPNSELINRRVAECLTARYGARVGVDLYDKPNMALPAPTDVLRAIAERASLLVTGSGD